MIDELGIEIGREHDMKFINTFNLMWPHATTVVNRLSDYLGDCSLNDEDPVMDYAIAHVRAEVMSMSKTLPFGCEREEAMICSFLASLAASVCKLANWRAVDDSGAIWDYKSQSYKSWASGKEGVKFIKANNIESSPDWVLEVMLTDKVRNNLGKDVIDEIREEAMKHGS